jgi:metal transporter CNNM
MTNIEKVFMLDVSTKLDSATLRKVYSKGHSRIPVYDRSKQNIIGILMSRDLILVNPERALLSLKQLSSIIMSDVIAVDFDDKIEPILNYFKKGLTHFGVVTKVVAQGTGLDPIKTVVGIVTMEDIIERLLGDQIEDEYEANEERHQRRLLKEKLALYYTDSRASK